MMDCDLTVKSLSRRDFLKFRLGKDNTREIIQNCFETTKYTLSESRRFVFKNNINQACYYPKKYW